MDRLPLAQGFAQYAGQFVERADLFHADLLRQRVQTRLRAHPDDIVYGGLIAKKRFRTLVCIQQHRQVRQANTGKIEEVAVLPERVDIIGIVHRRFLIAGKQDQPLSHFLHQAPAALRVRSSGGHFLWILADFL